MGWHGERHTLSLTPFLLDTREFITDKCVLRQLAFFAHMHRLGSPLWLSWDLSAGLGLTLRHMQSPLHIWSPLVGEGFIPLLRSSPFTHEVLHKYPVTQILNFSKKEDSLGNSTTKQVVALSAAACSDGQPRWCSVPETMRHLFNLPKTNPPPSYLTQCGNKLFSPVLWVSAALLSCIKATPESQLLVRTPASGMCLVNADQLYPSFFLSEKELECSLLQPKGMSWNLIGRPVAMCATMAATTTVLSWLYRPAPLALSEEIPSVALNDCDGVLEPLWKYMRFLDTRMTEWKVESSNFRKGGKESSSGDGPKVQVLRLGSSYLADATNGPPTPFMRVVGFFPGVLPEEIFGFMTDLKLRRQWDRNYHMFCKFDRSNEENRLEGLESVKRPVEMIAKKTYVCQNDSCVILPDIAHHVVDQGWFAHRVRHSLLDRFGIADRLFVYQRRSVCYTKVDTDGNTPKMYDVLYSGDNESIKRANEQSESFALWLRSCEKEQEATRVNVNYQHILIVPIADAESQLWADPLRLSCGGSMVDRTTTEIIYDAFVNTVRLYRETNKLDGTLMIMTSANDVQMPSSVPCWAQRMLASFLTNHAHREMFKAICDHRKQLNT